MTLRRGRGSFTAVALSAVVLAATAAWADEPKVAVQADVVFASTASGTVEPALKKMQDTLGSRVKYATLKTLTTKTIQLTAKKPEQLALPNKKTAELVLQALRDDVATVRVKLPPAETTYTLARDKSLYLQGGAHEGGELWLVLSQPR